ncbi:putative phage-type endonuclease [compost metagenome]
MKIIDVVQGSAEWLAERAKRDTASEAPAMMGASRYQTRAELMRQKATGISPEVGGFKQQLFDRGHETEAAARLLVEQMVGEELFPVTMVSDDDKLLASMDGQTMTGEIGYEHKLWSEALADQLRRNELEPHYYWQLEHQLLVSPEMEKIIFVCSDGTKDRFVSIEYRRVPGRAEQLQAGWAQFNEDLANFKPTEVAQVAVGTAVMALPALVIQIKGEVKSSNLTIYKATCEKFIASIKTDLKTDQDFADAETMVKFCESTETELDTVKKLALAQTTTIESLFNTIDQLKESMRGKRLTLEKLVKNRKDQIRLEVVQKNTAEMAEHMAGLNTRLGRPYMPAVPVDFAGVIKGKRTIAGLEDACATELARGKIEANAIADRIQINLNVLREKGKDHAFLFNDVSQIVLKANDDLNTLVEKRISDHQAEQKRKDDETRENARKDADAKAAEFSRAALVKIQGIQNRLQAAQGAKPAAIRQLLADTEAIVVDVATFGVHNDLAVDAKRQTVDALKAMVFYPNGAPRYSTTTFRDDGEPIMLNDDGTRSVFCDVDEEPGEALAARPAAAAAPVSAPAANVVPMRQPAPATQVLTPPNLKLGTINERLAPIQLTAAGMTTLGFEPAGKSGSAVLYHERDFPHMCAAVIEHVNQVQAKQAA